MDAMKEECFEIEIPFELFQYLSSENCDVQSLCRICLSTNKKDMYPLISADDKFILREMFTSITSIQVFPDDGLPAFVCNLCKSHIITCNEFRSQCIKADCALKSLLKVEFAKEEPVDVSEDKVLEVPNTRLIEEIPTSGVEEIDNNVKEENLEIKQDDEEIVNTRGGAEIDDNVKAESQDIIQDDQEFVEDIQYLEDLSESDNEVLSNLQSSIKLKEERNADDPEQTAAGALRTKKAKHKRKKLVCSFCKKKFCNKKTLKDHIDRIHNSAKHTYKCLQCKVSYQTENDLTLHLPVHGPGPEWVCVGCGKACKGRSGFRRHVKRHMAREWACGAPGCGKAFAERYALRRHARVHTGERVEKRHACQLCDKRYCESGLLAAHMRVHAGARPCVCATCGRAFSTARLLASHARLHSDDKPHRCSHCDKRFRHESTRNTHERTHTGERPYVCAACGKRFIQNSNLTLHMRTHTGERPYACATCGARFSSGSTLKAHARTHTGDKPFACPTCGKRFARQDLRTHQQQHTGERPFACVLCARRFHTRARLREHERVHTGEQPFQCDTCSKKFSSKALLVKHTKTHSNGKNEKSKSIATHKRSESRSKPDDSNKDLEMGESMSTIDVVGESRDMDTDVLHDDAVTGEIILSSETDELPSTFGAGADARARASPSAAVGNSTLLPANSADIRVTAGGGSREGATARVTLYRVDHPRIFGHLAR